MILSLFSNLWPLPRVLDSNFMKGCSLRFCVAHLWVRRKDTDRLNYLENLVAFHTAELDQCAEGRFWQARCPSVLTSSWRNSVLNKQCVCFFKRYLGVAVLEGLRIYVKTFYVASDFLNKTLLSFKFPLCLVLIIESGWRIQKWGYFSKAIEPLTVKVYTNFPAHRSFLTQKAKWKISCSLLCPPSFWEGR